MREEERAMPWARLDDSFYDHPKILKVSLAAAGLFAIGLSYSSRYLTDGHVPRDVVQRRKGCARAAQELVEQRLWEEVSDGWRVHDWKQWNDTREAVLTGRAKAAERKRVWRDSSGRTNGVTPASGPAGSHV